MMEKTSRDGYVSDPYEHHKLVMEAIGHVHDRLNHIQYNELPHLWGTARKIERMFYALCGMLVGIGILEVVGWVR